MRSHFMFFLPQRWNTFPASEMDKRKQFEVNVRKDFVIVL